MAAGIISKIYNGSASVTTVYLSSRRKTFRLVKSASTANIHKIINLNIVVIPPFIFKQHPRFCGTGNDTISEKYINIYVNLIF